MSLRNDLPQLVLVIIALVGCISLLLGFVSMARRGAPGEPIGSAVLPEPPTVQLATDA